MIEGVHTMNRRHFLRSAGAASVSLVLPKTEWLLAEDRSFARWGTFEGKTRVEILTSSGATRVWLPAALTSKTPFQKTLSNEFYAEGGTVRMDESKGDGIGISTAEF